MTDQVRAEKLLRETNAKLVEEAKEREQAAEELRRITNELRLAKQRLAEEKLYLEREIHSELGLDAIVGQSRALQDVMENVGKVASSDATVLLLGETGTGKELIARAIHRQSAAVTPPFGHGRDHRARTSPSHTGKVRRPDRRKPRRRRTAWNDAGHSAVQTQATGRSIPRATVTDPQSRVAGGSRQLPSVVCCAVHRVKSVWRVQHAVSVCAIPADKPCSSRKYQVEPRPVPAAHSCQES